MNIHVKKKYGTVLILLSLACITLASLEACKQQNVDGPSGFPASDTTITITTVVPSDIFSNGDSSSGASLRQAAFFAWKEFIALNWKAKVGYRDSADNSIPFGADAPGIPLVWETFRHKVEIFPGNGLPPHGFDISKPDYGYNDTTFQPKYFYNPDSTQTIDGQIQPYNGEGSSRTPWVNLDESNEIGQANMYAGVYPTQMLYMAKANKQEYKYAVKTGWYNNNSNFKFAQKATKDYILANKITPKPGMGDSLISLPYNTIEIKTAWRLLTESEKNSGKFFMDTVRTYPKREKKIYYNDEVYGMVALHIIQKTKTAPYFIFATFEQNDNILDSSGNPVEDADGNMLINPDESLTPALKVTNALANGTPMHFSPKIANAIPGQSLYYQNISSNSRLTTGTIRINKRLNPIPQDIIDVNKKAHAAIKDYGKKHLRKDPVWMNYKLINVQYKPIHKTNAGGDYHGPDSASYYQSNSVVESDYILQKFSGRFDTLGTITDFTATGDTAFNAYNGKRNLMGGCMGCHGNATNTFQTDYSFIFGFPVTQPESSGTIGGLEATRKLVRFYGKNR